MVKVYVDYILNEKITVNFKFVNFLKLKFLIFIFLV